MPISVSLYRKLEDVEPQLRSVLIAILEEIEHQREETVTKIEFNELKEIVRDLADAQRNTEIKLSELSEAQKNTEVKLGELSEAQKNTEVKLSELSEAQKNTEKELRELVQAQKEMQGELREVRFELSALTKEHTITREQVGGLSNTVGYVLENEAFKFLPTLLKDEFGLEIIKNIERKFIQDNKGQKIEVNIVAEASRNGDKFVIIGECKAQLSKKKVSTFLRKKLKRIEGVYEAELFPILVTHMISEPDVEEYAKSEGIKRIYYSYEF